MNLRLRLGLVAAISAFACHHGPPKAAHEITVQPLEPHMGDIKPKCDMDNGDLLLHVTATCVVDLNKRIVVKDRANHRVLLDSLKQPDLVLPNFPSGEQHVQVRLQRKRFPVVLESMKRPLLIQLTGECGKEQAAGSFYCDVKAKEI